MRKTEITGWPGRLVRAILSAVSIIMLAAITAPAGMAQTTYTVCSKQGSELDLNSANTSGMRAKLSNGNYFGPGGTVAPEQMAFQSLFSVNSTSLAACDIFIGGGGPENLSISETQAIRTWVNSGNRFVIAGCDSSTQLLCGPNGLQRSLTNVGSGSGVSLNFSLAYNPLTCGGVAGVDTYGGAATLISPLGTDSVLATHNGGFSGQPAAIAPDLVSPNFLMTADPDMYGSAGNGVIGTSSIASSDQAVFVLNSFKFAADALSGRLLNPQCPVDYNSTGDLEIGLAASAVSVSVGGNVDFEIEVANTGGGSVGAIQAVFRVPAGFSYVSDNGAGNYDDATGLWSIGTLNPGTSVTLTVSATATALGASQAQAEITNADLPDSDSAPNASFAEDDLADGLNDDDEATLALTVASSPTTGIINYPDAGNGQYFGSMALLDWSGSGLEDGIQEGERVSFTLPACRAGTLTATFSNVTNPANAASYVPSDMQTWPGASFHNLYNGSGNGEAIYGADGADTGFRIDWSMTVNGAARAPDLFLIDAETTFPGVESITATTNGGGWSLIEDAIGNGYVVTGLGTQTAQITSSESPSHSPLLLSMGTTRTDISIDAGGREAVAFALLLPCDGGDAGGIAETAHAFGQRPGVGGGLGFTPGQLFVGQAPPDSEQPGQANGDATGDDGDALGDDEDGVVLPALLQGASATISVEVNQMAANEGYLQGWIDWNGDGDFADAGEQVASDLQSASAGNSTLSVPVTVPVTATTNATFARFRWSSQPGLDASAPAPDGEVEDYSLTIQADPGNLADARVTDTCPMPSVYVANGTSASWPTRPGVTVTAVSDMNALTTNATREFRNVGDEIRPGVEVTRWQRNGGDISLQLDFSPDLPANEIALLVYDLGLGAATPYQGEFALAVTGGASTQDFRAAAITEHTDTLVYAPTSGRLAKSDPSHSVRESVVLVGQNTNPVSQMVLTSSAVSAADFLGIALFAVSDCDHSDAPSAYGEARAMIVDGLGLGASIDGENGAQSGPGADGDDNDATGDDEDGVTFPTLTQGQGAVISVDVDQASANQAYLQGWIDWNGDGDFADAGEQVASDLQSTSAGTSTISVPVTVPVTATTSPTFSRFRWSTVAGLDSVSPAPDGEVEDHSVTVLPGGIDVSGRVFEDNGAGAASAHDGLFAGDEAGLGAVRIEARDGAGTVIASTQSDGDGLYALNLPNSAAGSPVTLHTALAGADWRYISGVPGDLPAPADTLASDGAVSFTPVLGADYSGVDIGQVQDPGLEAPRLASAVAGQSVTLAHTFTARTAGQVVFSLADIAPNPANAFTQTLFSDSDCDGVIGAGDTALAGTVDLVAGETVCLAVRVGVDGGAVSGATLDYRLVADFAYQGTTRTVQLGNDDRVSVSQNGALELTKQVCNSSVSACNPASGAGFTASNTGAPGDILVYLIGFANPGPDAIDDVDVYDDTPAYSALTATAPGVVAAPAGLACALIAPAPAAAGYEGDLHWACTGSMAPGETGAVSFEVVVDD